MAKDASDFDYDPATVPPGALFVAADEPLLVYPSTTAAERDLEAIDVENNVYSAAYGPNGEPYRIESQGNRVIVEPADEPNRPDELQALLLRYLRAIGRVPDVTASLDDLVASVWKIESDFWQEHDPHGDRFSKPLPSWSCLALLLVPVTLLLVVGATYPDPLIGFLAAALVLWPVGVLAKRKADKTDF